MSALPVEGYAQEYTDAAQLLADIADRKRRLAALRYTPPPPPPPILKEFLAKYVEVPIQLAPFPAPKRSTWSHVTEMVRRETGISRHEIESVRRQAPIVNARMIACWLMRAHTSLSYPQIGHAVGGRDHTTILHACQTIDRRRQHEPALDALLEQLSAELKERLA